MSSDVVIVGGGLIGLATGWRAALAGLSVTVVDPAPGSGSSYAAAGMLAPVTEAHYGEERLLRLNLAAGRRYPSFVAEVEEASGRDVGYRTTGTLAVALDSGDRAVLAAHRDFLHKLGLSAELLGSREMRGHEPLLAPGIRGGLLVADDHQVDNRRLCAALLIAAERAGVTVRRTRAAEIVVDADRATGVRLADGDLLTGATVVLAAGCWSGQLGGLPTEAVPPVRPVKGQILRLRTPDGTPFLRRIVRGVVAGTFVYVVPRAHGEVVVGGTVEEHGFDTTVTAGAVHELLRNAGAVVPGLAELELVECHAGLRPGSPDNAPLLGRTTLDGLVAATGHFRNGVLLTPVTADAIATLLSTGETPPEIAPFSPLRFARVAVP